MTTRAHIVVSACLDEDTALDAIDDLLAALEAGSAKLAEHPRESDIGRLRGGLATVRARLPAGRVRILVKRGGETMSVATQEIEWCEARDNYVCIHAGELGIICRITMSAMLEQLPTSMFVRIHRSSIVNMHRVRGCAPNLSP